MIMLTQPTRKPLGLSAPSAVERIEADPPARSRRQAANGSAPRPGPAGPEGASA